MPDDGLHRLPHHGNDEIALDAPDVDFLVLSEECVATHYQVVLIREQVGLSRAFNGRLILFDDVHELLGNIAPELSLVPLQ